MMDEDSDGVRLKIIPCVKEQFRRRMEATKVLEDDFYVPNRAQLMLDFLQKHGDRVVKETPGPKKRFRSTLKLVQHVLHKESGLPWGLGFCNPTILLCICRYQIVWDSGAHSRR